MSIGGRLLSRLYRRAEALDQACLRAQGHPHDYGLRQELLSALEWEESFYPKHAATLIRDLFKQVHDHSTRLSSRLAQAGPQVGSLPVSAIQSLRQHLEKLRHV